MMIVQYFVFDRKWFLSIILLFLLLRNGDPWNFTQDDPRGKLHGWDEVWVGGWGGLVCQEGVGCSGKSSSRRAAATEFTETPDWAALTFAVTSFLIRLHFSVLSLTDGQTFSFINFNCSTIFFKFAARLRLGPAKLGMPQYFSLSVTRSKKKKASCTLFSTCFNNLFWKCLSFLSKPELADHTKVKIFKFELFEKQVPAPVVISPGLLQLRSRSVLVSNHWMDLSGTLTWKARCRCLPWRRTSPGYRCPWWRCSGWRQTFQRKCDQDAAQREEERNQSEGSGWWQCFLHCSQKCSLSTSVLQPA